MPRGKQRVVILGSGFAGIEVLKQLQKKFHDSDVDIVLISRDNFVLFTPLLPEVFSGMIDPRQITTPVRAFLNDATFYQANVESIDFDNKKVRISHTIGKYFEPIDMREHSVDYDFLVIALGNEENFFGIESVEQHAFTMSGVIDAIRLRNHVINVLEQATLEARDETLRKKLLTFVIVGGGFNGIETAGELNDFVRGIAKAHYNGIPEDEIRIILVHATDTVLEQVEKELGDYALENLKKRGVEFILNTLVSEASETSITLDNGAIIPTFTLVWSAGVVPSKLVAKLDCPHDDKHRIRVNRYLEVENHEGSAYAVGDCASVPKDSSDTYPPTAQHALTEAKTLAKNLVCDIEMRPGYKKKFDYDTKGMMAEIGRRNGVASLLGFKIRGFAAWWIWRTFYLTKLPTFRKKLKVMSDWTIGLFYEPDVSMVKRVQKSDKEKILRAKKRSFSEAS